MKVMAGTAITTVGILSYILFGRIDTMAGLFLMAVLVICQGELKKVKEK